MLNFGVYSFIVCLLMLSLGNFAYAQDKPNEPAAAATVNGIRIPMAQLDEEISEIMASHPELKEKRNIAELRKARKDALDFLIIQELMVQEGKKAGLDPKADEVESEFTKTKQRFPSEALFQQVLKQQGLTEGKLKDVIRRGLTIRKILDAKVKPLAEPVKDEEIAEFYNTNKSGFVEQEKIRASHILLKVGSGATDQEKADAEKKIRDILKQAKDGGDFAELAKKNSQCPSAAQGGDLQYFSRGQMVKPFEDKAFAMEVGQISDPVLTEFGYHIIKVTDKKSQRQLELKEVSGQIKEILAEENMNVATEKWLEPLRKAADIQIMVKN